MRVSPRITRYAIGIGLLSVVAGSDAAPEPKPALVDVSHEAGVYADLRSVVTRWLDAVLHHDVGRLVALAAPETRDGIRRQLLDDQSELTRILFVGKRSVRSRFAQVSRPRIYLFEHTELAKAGMGTTVCITRDPLPEPLPDSLEKLPPSLGPEPVFCQFFWRDDTAEKQWYPNYSYGSSDDGA